MTVQKIPLPPVNPGVTDPKEVGKTYHLAIGSADGQWLYGYMLAQGIPFKESTDVNRKAQLTQYSSPNLTDRDISDWPRITDGDFSGGRNQVTFVTASKYWDGNLDTQVAGYLRLNSGWSRRAVSNGTSQIAAMPPFQYGDRTVQITKGRPPSGTHVDRLYWTYGEVGGTYYFLDPGGAITPIATGLSAVKALFADESGVYLADDAGGFWHQDIGLGGPRPVWTTGGSAVEDFWIVDDGGSGYFAYVVRPQPSNDLTRIDLSQWTGVGVVPPAAVSQVAFGTLHHLVADVVPYLGGIAILVNSPAALEVWTDTGSGASRLVSLPGYYAYGLVNALGDLYVTANPMAGIGPAFIVHISGSTFELVERIGLPLAEVSQQILGAPTTTGSHVYFTVQTAGSVLPPAGGLAGTTTGTRHIEVYDVVNGSLRALPDLDSIDWPGLYPRQLQGVGLGVAFPMVPVGASTPLTLQVTHNTGMAAGGADVYSRGPDFLVSSRIDGNTPALDKMVQEVMAEHAPLVAGQAITLGVVVDGDPTAYVDGTTAFTASTTHMFDPTETAAQASRTEIQMPLNTMCRSLYFVVKLTGPGSTSPLVYSVALEFTTSFVWEFTVDCTSVVTTLGGGEQRDDQQRLKGVERLALLRNIWLAGQPRKAVFYHPDGSGPWDVVMESMEFVADSPMAREVDIMHHGDLEGFATVKLRAVGG